MARFIGAEARAQVRQLELPLGQGSKQGEFLMLFMVIERFKNGEAAPVYQRFQEQGRMLPEGLIYLNSWTDSGFRRCFQLMECDDLRLFDEWISHWQDLVDFEIVPVLSSKEAVNSITPSS